MKDFISTFTHSATFQPTIKEWPVSMLDELANVPGKPEVYTTMRGGNEVISRIKLIFKEVNDEVVLGNFFRNDDMSWISEIVGSGKMIMRTQDRRRDPNARARCHKYIVEDGYAFPVRYPGSTNRKRETRVL